MTNAEIALKKLAEDQANTKYEVARLKAQEVSHNLSRPKLMRNEKNIASAVVDEPAQTDRYTLLDARKDYENGGSRSTVCDWSETKSKHFAEFMQDVAAKAAGPYTETTTAGGYLLPTEFSPEVIRLMYMKSIALQNCRIVPMNNLQMNLPKQSTQATPIWGGINTQIGDTVGSFDQISLTAEKLVGLSNVPNELMHDTPVALAQYITNEWAEGFAKKIDEEVFQGDTSDTTNHKFNGWQEAASVEEVAGDTGDSADGAITTSNLLDLMAKFDEIEITGAKWYMHPTVWASVRGLVDTNSDLLVGPTENFRYNLFGYPVVLSSYATPTKASIAAAKPVVLFGNMNNIIIGDCLSLDISSTQYFRFDYDQTTFRAIQRLAIAVAWPQGLAKLTRGPA